MCCERNLKCGSMEARSIQTSARGQHTTRDDIASLGQIHQRFLSCRRRTPKARADEATASKEETTYEGANPTRHKPEAVVCRISPGSAGSSSPVPRPRSPPSRPQAPKRQPLDAAWANPAYSYSPAECFLPHPKITFLVDRPRGLVCQICKVSSLSVRSERDAGLLDDDCTPAVLPCGHVAGARCLEEWFRSGAGSRRDCPFCRKRLTYAACGHRVHERRVTQESVHLLPKTLPAGGCLPDRCAECTKRVLKKAAERRYDDTNREFMEARSRYHRTGSAADELLLLVKKDQLENLMLEDLHVMHVNGWLRNW